MAITIQLSQERYDQIKSDVLDRKTIRRVDIRLSEIEILDLKSISVNFDGVKKEIFLTRTAVSDLVESIGVPKVFIETVNKAYKNDKAILNSIIKAVKRDKVKILTFVYNVKLNEIVAIYPEGKKLISDAEYFNTLESLMAKTPGSYLRNLTQKANGDLSAIVANPELKFNFGNFKDEWFTAGMTLDLSAARMMTSFFTERLVCTNGMKTQHKLCTKSVEVTEGVPDFMAAVLSKEYHLGSVAEFKKRLHRCYYTVASLREVIHVDSTLRRSLGSQADILMSEMSAPHIKARFGDEYLAATDQHKYLRTDISLWELVNEITAVSSKIEQQKMQVAERTNLVIQKLGGDMMFRTPDLAPSNVKQVFPEMYTFSINGNAERN